MAGTVLTEDDGSVSSQGTAHATFATPYLPMAELVEPPLDPPATTLLLATPPTEAQVNVASAAGRVAVDGALLAPVTVTLTLTGVTGSTTPATFEISDGTPEFTYTVTATSAGTGTVTASAPGLTSAQHSITVTSAAVSYVALPNVLFQMDPSRAFGVANVESSPSGLAYNSGNRVMTIYGNLETHKQGVVNCDVSGRAPVACPLSSPAKGSTGFDADEVFFNTLGNATGQAYAPIKRLAAADGSNPTGMDVYRFQVDKIKHGWTASDKKNRAQLKQAWGTQATSLASPWGTEFWSAFMVWLPSELQNINFGWWLIQEQHASDSGGLSAGGGLGYELANNGALGMKLKKKLERYTGPWPNAVNGAVSPVNDGPDDKYPKTIATLPFNKKCWIITNFRENPGFADPNPDIGACYGPATAPYNGFCNTYLAIEDASAVLLDEWPAGGAKNGKWCSPYAPTDTNKIKVSNLVSSIEPDTYGDRLLRPTQYPVIGIYCINSWPNASVQAINVYFGKFLWLRTQDQPETDFGVNDVLYKIRGS